MNYYASPTGLPGNAGTIGSPWDLSTALNNGSQTSGDTLYLRGGTYTQKCVSTLTGGTVRSYPGEWAVVDGNVFTTLVGSIDSSQDHYTVADASKILLSGQGDEVAIDLEILKGGVKSGNNITGVSFRGASGTVGSATSHANGTPVYQAGPQFVVSGSNTTYANFEITNSVTDRNETAYPSFAYGNGVFVTGAGNSFRNLIIHDSGTGFFTSSASSNTLIDGCLIFNCGATHNDGSTYGISTYLENSSGYSRVYDTFELNCFSINFQGYGVSGPYVGGDVQGCVFANAGVHTGPLKQNMIYGPESQVSPTASVQDCHFYHTPGTSSFSVNFGYGAGITTGTFINNYFFGSGSAFEASNITNLTFTGNKFYSTDSGDRYTICGDAGFTWDNNTYYGTTSQSRFNQDPVGDFTFTAWKPIFTYDTHSTATGSALPDQAIVRPNAYETGRANVIIYAPSNPSSINVDLSTTGLVNGQTYTIKNAFNYFGTNVATGTYNSGSPIISIPLGVGSAARSVATPTGWAGGAPVTTVPNFAAMIVIPGAASVSTLNKIRRRGKPKGTFHKS